MIEDGNFMSKNLRIFLNERELLSKFEANVRDGIAQNWEGSTNEASILGNCFSWGNSPEGMSFWNKIDAEWGTYLWGLSNAN